MLSNPGPFMQWQVNYNFNFITEYILKFMTARQGFCVGGPYV